MPAEQGKAAKLAQLSLRRKGTIFPPHKSFREPANFRESFLLLSWLYR